MESFDFWNRSSSMYNRPAKVAAAAAEEEEEERRCIRGLGRPGRWAHPLPARLPTLALTLTPIPFLILLLQVLASPCSFFGFQKALICCMFVIIIAAGTGIRVAIKPEYRITPPPPLAPQMSEVPRSTFQFDFDFEKRILAEAEKGSQNWTRIAADTQSTKAAPSTSADPKHETYMSYGSRVEPVRDSIVNKYVASGLSREAVSLAVLNYGDNPIKVREFVKGYNLLREMGFSSKNVAEALAMYDNNTDKALAYFLNSS